MKTLKLCIGTDEQGLSNCLLNIFVIMMHMLITKPYYSRLKIYMPATRYDNPCLFCKHINNKHLELITLKKGYVCRLQATKQYVNTFWFDFVEQIKDYSGDKCPFKIRGINLPIYWVMETTKWFTVINNNDICNKISTIKQLYKNSPYLAIHIRTTDFPIYKKCAKRKKEYLFYDPFVKVINKYIEDNPDNWVYIATDSLQSQQWLKKNCKQVYFGEDISARVISTNRFVSPYSIYIDYEMCIQSETFLPYFGSTLSDYIILQRWLRHET